VDALQQKRMCATAGWPDQDVSVFVQQAVADDHHGECDDELEEDLLPYEEPGVLPTQSKPS